MPEPGSPLAYMLSVIADETADPLRRDKMAIAAASYFHGAALQPVGKKQRLQLAAERVGDGWGELLRPGPPPKILPPRSN
jgi:hypothetical protein